MKARPFDTSSGTLGVVSRSAAELLGRYGLSVGDREVVVGCSGGVDSTVLLHVLLALGARPIVVHVNYGLRGRESDRDEANVRSACRQLDLDLVVERAEDVGDLITNGSLQEAARRVRYAAFSRVASERSVLYVAVGHTLDDQSETVLLQLMRGSGIRGFAGMRVVSGTGEGSGPVIIRPLLMSSREVVERAATGLSTRWAFDSSNKDPKYARARLRSNVMPAIESNFGRSRWLNIGRSGLQTGNVDQAESDKVKDLIHDLSGPAGAALSVDGLLGLDPPLRGRVILEAIRRWAPELPETADSVRRIEGLLHTQPGRRVKTGNSVAIRDRAELVFRVEDDSAEPLTLRPGEAVPCGRVIIHLHELARVPRGVDPLSRDVAYVDLDSLTDPLVARPWRHGDRMQLLGTDGTKLVSDLLTDARVAVWRRSAVPVVLSGNEVLWIAGVGRSAVGLITEDTRRAGILVRATTAIPDDSTDERAPGSQAS